MRIFDTHAHYYDDAFNADREQLLSSLKDKNVCGAINCGVDIESSLECIELSEKFVFLYTAAGYHPENIPENGIFERDKLISILQNKKVVAIGEIGLDYYWDTSRKELQKDFFEKQLCLAQQLDLPVIIHSRDAAQDTLEIIKKYNVKGVMHCFSGSVEIAEKYLQLGFYLGFGGASTFKNAKKIRDVIETVPMNRILLETDCPYMSPEPFRGKRNDSSRIIYIAEKISEIKNLPTDYVLTEAYKNAKSLFNVV